MKQTAPGVINYITFPAGGVDFGEILALDVRRTGSAQGAISE